MDKTTVKCTEMDRDVGADILSKSRDRLVVVLDGTDIKLTLFKRGRVYVCSLRGFEYTSTGE